MLHFTIYIIPPLDQCSIPGVFPHKQHGLSFSISFYPFLCCFYFLYTFWAKIKTIHPCCTFSTYSSVTSNNTTFKSAPSCMCNNGAVRHITQQRCFPFPAKLAKIIFWDKLNHFIHAHSPFHGSGSGIQAMHFAFEPLTSPLQCPIHQLS